jgi:heavy metal sensor kinase
MKSIRLSLSVYFLGLLAVALGAVSVLVYRTAQQTLQATEEKQAELIEAQFRERCRVEEKRLDEGLFTQAQTLARLVQFQFDWNWNSIHRRELHVLGLLSSNLSPNGHVLAPLWISEGIRSPFFFEIHHRALSEVKLKPAEGLQHLLPGKGQMAEFFQIDGSWGGSYHSPEMGDNSFPLDQINFGRNEAVHWECDDTYLDPETQVRRIILKVPYAPDSIKRDQPAPDSFKRDQRPRPPRPEFNRPRPYMPQPAVFIQCAYDLRKRSETFAGFQEQRDEKLAEVEEESRAALANLRNRLLVMNAITFIATMVGSLWLVRLGLSPLQRVSHAVSQVSARDFRLHLEEPRLPSELRPIVDRLSDTLDLLKRAFAREKQATADISHELRTPLAALLTTTELALRKPRTPEQYQEMLQDCRLSAQQMNQVVERLLTLARLDAGVDLVRPQRVDVNELAEQCAAVVRPLAEARGLKVNVFHHDDTPLTTDPDKLREVLTNLLHNAIQYNRPNGSVDLLVERTNGHVELQVRDTGIGIGLEARTHIFERFYRADPSRGSDGLHAGLGLAIVKEYVDLIGGTITVESTEDQGSTFSVQLPLSA